MRECLCHASMGPPRDMRPDIDHNLFFSIHFFVCPKKRTKERAPRTRFSIKCEFSMNFYHSNCARGENASRLLCILAPDILQLKTFYQIACFFYFGLLLLPVILIHRSLR